MTGINIYRVKSVTVEPTGKHTALGYSCTIEVETEQGGASITLYADSRSALDFVVDAPAEKGGIWPHSKMPTCPDCGWPPMVDADSPDAPASCMCEKAA